MQNRKGFFRYCFIPVSIIAIAFLPLKRGQENSARLALYDGISQQVTFAPQMTPLVYPTLSPMQIATAMYLYGPVEYEKGASSSPTYR